MMRLLTGGQSKAATIRHLSAALEEANNSALFWRSQAQTMAKHYATLSEEMKALERDNQSLRHEVARLKGLAHLPGMQGVAESMERRH